MVSVSLSQKTHILEDSGARKMENFTFKAPRKAFLLALLIASIYEFGCAVEGVVWLFFFYHNEFFRKLNKSVLDCQKVERNSKPSILFQYWYMLHQGFDRELPLPQNLPHRTGPQYSTNLEVWNVDQSLALRFKILLRPDQSRQETEITNKQSLNSELMNIPKFLDFSSPVFNSYIFCFRDFSSKGKWNGWRKPSYQFYWRQILLLEYRSCEQTFRWAKSAMRANVFGKSALLFIQPGCLPGQQR